MRHMETYMGEKLKDWNPGLKKSCSKQMRILRAKYYNALLNSEFNEKREEVNKEADDYYNSECAKGQLDVQHFIETYVKQPSKKK